MTEAGHTEMHQSPMKITMATHEPIENVIRRMLAAKRIAVVGLSDDPTRPSYDVANYLRRQGYEILPVNPNCESVFGRKSAATLNEIDGPVDLVNVFRRSEFCEDIVKDAIAIGARGVWLQAGVASAPAAKLAKDAGIDFVQNRCIKIDHMRFGGER